MKLSKAFGAALIIAACVATVATAELGDPGEWGRADRYDISPSGHDGPDPYVPDKYPGCDPYLSFMLDHPGFPAGTYYFCAVAGLDNESAAWCHNLGDRSVLLGDCCGTETFPANLY